MTAARRIAENEHFLRRGEWTRRPCDMFAGSDVHGATLGIPGMGRIGQAIARRGALGTSCWCCRIRPRAIIRSVPPVSKARARTSMRSP
jgi:lactate dehydrogenase-like 2-hydroxyacid dehydrogenase